MKIRSIIVDDEPAARRGLARLLRREPDVEIVAECADGTQALEAIRALRPQLVFLDIQMPEPGGIEVARTLASDELPAIVFVTAFDQFALAAFDVHAVDYVVKPVDPVRLSAAVSRARLRLAEPAPRSSDDALRQALAALGYSAQPAWPSRMALKTAGRIVLLDVARITRIDAAGSSVTVRTGKDGKPHTVRESMTAMASKLDPKTFARISRSTIVNLDKVTELQPLFDGDFVAILEDGSHATGSRRYREQVARWFEQ